MYHVVEWTWVDAAGARLAPGESPSMGWVVVESLPTLADVRWYLRTVAGCRTPADLERFEVIAW